MSMRFRSAPALCASFLAVCAATACKETKGVPPPPESVHTASSATGAQASAAPAVAQRRMVLCAHQLGKPSKEAPQVAVSRAGQQSSLPEKLPIGEGHWTWINLFRTSCDSCKQQLPLLQAWEKDTQSERVPLKVAFVSVDDDPAQLAAFLAPSNPNGLRASYWLRPGEERSAWFKEAGLDADVPLPAQLLVDPARRVRCVQEGALDDDDFDQVLKILRGARGGAGAGTRGTDQNGFGGAPRKP